MLGSLLSQFAQHLLADWRNIIEFCCSADHVANLLLIGPGYRRPPVELYH